ncbi:ImmA/IrrE family metallo-endopeptidase [Exiguobacterium sp. s130]|uniref:ImmA/IrrE family metallo-endopeptidase n=1 Tax=Exiguobacterium sp. s130 TaxID=2751190 RepID=UPI001BE7130D|nr:ImmA/IrrE family metallo-endopeptidase [Exiguobacterium sp. s130]
MSQSQFKAKPRSKNDLKMFAFGLRSALEMEDVPQIDIIRILEHDLLGAFGEALELEIVDVSEMEEYALYRFDLNKIIIREDVYIAAANMNPRHRFTIAHEIGHLFLHKHVKQLARSDVKRKIFEDPEWQANVFAAEFLAPTHLIGDLSPSEIASTFGISNQAALKRFNDVQNNR